MVPHKGYFRAPSIAPASAPATPLEVLVLFTDVSATLCALRTAAQLAQGLTARVRLLVLECVPFSLPLDKPPVSIDFLNRRFRTMVDACAVESPCHSVETTAEIIICRDQWEALAARLGCNEVIVIGKRSRWWPRPEDRLAKRLSAAGHHVVRTSVSRGFAHA